MTSPGGARPQTAVITIAHRRHEHLRGLLWGLARQTLAPDSVVVVAMDDPGIELVVREQVAADQQSWHTLVLAKPRSVEGLPLAAARNVGAASAVDCGAQVLVFLDVDCIPSAGIMARYVESLWDERGSVALRGGPTVACGEVGYLPAVDHPQDYLGADLPSLAQPHPARPVLGPLELRPAEDVRQFWSLSFAVTSDDWQKLGGFDEGYVGYGAEDTDFGQRLDRAGGQLLWVGGAAAYHQHHESPNPPVQHLKAIVANANRFHDRWGWFPMEGWLAAFAEARLATLDQHARRWRVLDHP